MALASSSILHSGESPLGDFADHEPRWYVAHLRVNQEKRAAEQFSRRAVEYFLPLYESLRRWKDRRVTLTLPLFPGYVFVRIRLRDRLQVLETPGIARLVSFAGRPAALPDEEIEALREKLAGPVRAAPYRYLTAGRRVRVARGPLEGLEGFLVQRRGKSRMVISIDAIQRSIAVEVDAADVELAHSNGKRVLAESVARPSPTFRSFPSKLA